MAGNCEVDRVMNNLYEPAWLLAYRKNERTAEAVV